MAIPLEWKASIFGAEDVKAKLAEIRTEYQNGGMGIQEYTQKQTYLTRQLRQSNMSLGMQKSVFLATHPALNKLSQAMSVYGSVSRSVLSIMNAINLATLATHQNDQQIFDLNIQKMEQEKKIRELKEGGFGEGTAAYDEEIAKLKEINAQIKAIQEQSKKQDFANFITSMAGLGEAVSTGVTATILLLPQLKKLKDALVVLIPISWAAAGPWGIIAAGMIALGVAGYYLGTSLGLDKLSLESISYWWYTQGEPALSSLSNFFMVIIPTALGSAWSAITTFFTGFKNIVTTTLNGIIGGLESFINSFVKVINTLISAYNSIARRLKLGTISPLAEVKLPRIGSESNTSSGGGSQAVPFAGSAFSKSAGGVTIIVQGSILAQREVEKISGDALKNNLKRVGFG